MPNPQAGVPPLVACPHATAYSVCLQLPSISREAISSIFNLRMCHAMMTRDPLKMLIFVYATPKTELDLAEENSSFLQM
jgi:hypothetical protein